MMAEESETAARLSEEQKGSEREGELAVDEELEDGEIPEEESPEDVSAETMGGAVQAHPLEHSWTFWFDNPSAKSKQSAWGSSIRPIHTFSTVEDFWSLYNNIHHPSKLLVGADFHCFKHKIEPKWEDPLCTNGGKWTIACARGKSDTIWLYTLLAMIGEQFDYGDEICGVVVNVRGKQERIALWTKNASNEAAQEHQQAVFGGGGGSFEMADYMLNTPPAPPQPQNSLDRLSFAQFADFRPKLSPGVGLAMRVPGGDDVESCFFRFPPSLPSPPALPPPLLPQQHHRLHDAEEAEKLREIRELEEEEDEEEELARFSENTASSVQQSGFGGGGDGLQGMEGKSRRKRPRSMKTSEEVESQRMTHIAVERNRRRQMNDHLRVLRSLMPSSYVQRGDQASIIGGAIEFVRELEQLLQCLESQKRRRLYGNGTDPSLPLSMQQPPPPPPPPPFCLDTPGGGELREDMTENKSCLADVEVRLLGLDAMIKILSRRRPGQLLKTIAALEDMQLSILHTNITTVEQTVLYSFNVKITGEARCTAEEIADSVQQILGFIDSSILSSDQY